MKFHIKVKAGAKENLVKRVDETHFVVSVKAPPKEGKANLAVISVLSDFLDLPKSRFKLIKGEASKNKIIFVMS